MSGDDSNVHTWYPDAEGIGDSPDSDSISGPRYRDAAEVGQGSMGRVLSVHDTALGRRVAYKVMRKRAENPRSRARFLREAQITARLEHPGIVPVYDLGEEQGAPFYTMRFVVGRTLEDELRAATDLQRRLALLNHFLDASQAMAFAHARGVVHRDLKPENILVGDFGETLVADWGLAKVSGDAELATGPAIHTLDSDIHATSTRVGAILGTPAYMSPEQAHGVTTEINARSDVWSLGVILFEILTGKRPFHAASAEDLIQMVRSAPVPSPTDIAPNTPAELAAICTRALQRDPQLRYADAGELSHDIEAWLTGGWVRAHQYTPWERLGKFLARYRLPMGVLAACLWVMGVSAVLGINRVITERDKAQQAEAEGRIHLAEAFASRALTALKQQDLLEAELFAAAALDLHERPDARGVLSSTQAVWRPQLVRSFGPTTGCREVARTSVPGQVLCTGVNGVSLWDVNAPDIPIWSLPGDAFSAALSPDGTRIAALNSREFTLRDVSDGREIYRAEAPRVGSNPSVSWSPSGERVVYASRTAYWLIDRDGTLLYQGVDPDKGHVADVQFLNESTLLTLTISGVVHRTDLTDDTHVIGQVLSRDGAYALAVSPDQSLVVVGTGQNGLFFLDPTTLAVQRQVSGHQRPVLSIEIGPESQWIVTTSEDQTVRLVDSITGRQAFSLRLATPQIGHTALLASGQLVVASKGAQSQLYQLPTDRAATQFGDPESGLAGLAWSPSGARLATFNGEGQAQVWDRKTGQLVQTFHADQGVVRTGLFTDEETLFTASSNADLQRWRIGDDTPTTVLSAPRVMSIAYDAVHDRVWAARTNGQMLEISPTGQVLESFAAEPLSMWEVSVSANGDAMAWSNGEDAIQVVSLPERKPLWSKTSGLSPRAIALSPDGKTLALGQTDHQVWLRDLPSGAVVRELRGATNAVDELAFSPNGRWIAAASWDHRVYVWNVSTGELQATLSGHSHRVVDVMFSNDGQWLASASWDGYARIWSVAALTVDASSSLESLRQDLGVRLVGARLTPVQPPPRP